MTSLEANDSVKDGVDQETVEAVRNVGGHYKYCLLYTSPSPRD